MQVLVSAFEPEKMLARVSCCQGFLVVASAVPPQRLTASSPSTQTATAAPTSLRSWKLVSKASLTRSNLGAQVPLTVTRGRSFTSLLTATAVVGLKRRSYWAQPVKTDRQRLRVGCGWVAIRLWRRTAIRRCRLPRRACADRRARQRRGCLDEAPGTSHRSNRRM